MFRLTLMFGAASALNRGGLVVALPFLTRSLGADGWGLVVTIQGLVSLTWPLLSLNLPAGTFREALDVPANGARVARMSLGLSAAALLFGLALVFLLPISERWIGATIALGAMFAAQETALALFRAMNENISYLVVTAGRFLAIAFAAGTTFIKGLDIEGFVTLWLFLQLFFTTPAVLATLLVTRPASAERGLRVRAFAYSLPLILHSVSQWGLSAANRPILAALMSLAAAGLFGTATLFATPVLLLQSTLGIIIGRNILKNFSLWKNFHYRMRKIVIISISGICLTTLSQFILLFDFLGPEFAKIYHKDMSFIVGSVGSAFTLASIYLVYVNFLFYHRETGRTAKITLISGVISIALMVVLIITFGLIGAAVSLFLSYGVYVGLTMKAAFQIEPGAFSSRLRESSVVAAAAIVCMATTLAGQMIWSSAYNP